MEVPVRSAVYGLPEFLSASEQVQDGLRVGAALSFRAHASRSGTRLKNGSLPAVTPVPGAVPASVVLTPKAVLPLLDMAQALASRRGEVAIAAATARVANALRAHPAAAKAEGTSPLFDLAGHRPLARLLSTHGVATIPGEVILTGGGLRVTFTAVRFVRRMERCGDSVTPGRLFNWRPKGNGWLYAATARGRNGAGLRTVSRNWKDWVCGVAGAYDLEAIPEGWQLEWDGATVVVVDPGLLLPLCLADGRALSKGQWYRLRSVWADFVGKPRAVRKAEAELGRTGGQGRHPGAVAFARYVSAFHKAQPLLSSYYGSTVKAGAREYKMDKLRSLLDQLLMELAPNPQARAHPCTHASTHARMHVPPIDRLFPRPPPPGTPLVQTRRLGPAPGNTVCLPAAISVPTVSL